MFLFIVMLLAPWRLRGDKVTGPAQVGTEGGRKEGGREGREESVWQHKDRADNGGDDRG